MFDNSSLEESNLWKWLVQSKLPVNLPEEKLPVSSWPPRPLVRAHLQLVESRSLIDQMWNKSIWRKYSTCHCRHCIRLRAVPIFPLEFVEPQKVIANAGARKNKRNTLPRAGVRDVFPRLDELKRKNRDCSQSVYIACVEWFGHIFYSFGGS